MVVLPKILMPARWFSNRKHPTRTHKNWPLLTSPTRPKMPSPRPERSSPKFRLSSLNTLSYFPFEVCCFSAHGNVLPPALDPSGSFDCSSFNSNDFSSEEPSWTAPSTTGPPTALSDNTPSSVTDCGYSRWQCFPVYCPASHRGHKLCES